MLNQAETPLLTALQACAQQSEAAFYAPGHKRGQGSPANFVQLVGRSCLQADLPELPALDNLFAPTGVIQAAQTLAAEAFGARQTWFLANGSTAGIVAAILATCAPGRKLILPRNCHRSAIAGLILAGALPLFVAPAYDPDRDLVGGLTVTAVAEVLQSHPDAAAILLLSPTYQGISTDVRAIADLAHAYGIPLLVDEAHGPHFGFHPDFPPSALACGADLSVQSTHKVLAALSQAAMLHLNSDRIDSHRLQAALQLVQSTSPNYILLASLDAARQQMATQGHTLMQATLALADDLRSHLQSLPDLTLLQPDAPPFGTPGFTTLDPTRLTIITPSLGLSGFALDRWLQEHDVTAELATQHHLTFILSLGNTSADCDRLYRALAQFILERSSLNLQPCNLQPLARTGLIEPAWVGNAPSSQPIPSSQHFPLSPREVYFAPHTTVPIAAAIGQISAELVCPYPPGIPVLLPGELITETAVECLQQVLTQGGVITGCRDPHLQTLTVAAFT
ncbi:aminotransferase class I/II-fold pyridoxal phosphate-dependent enzyme [Trichothermofontia sp.]